MNWWWTDDELMMNWWWTDDEQMMNSRWTADEQLMNWWRTYDELMMNRWWTDDVLTDWFYSIEHKKLSPGMGWDGWMGYIPDSTNYKSTASGAKNNSKSLGLLNLTNLLTASLQKADQTNCALLDQLSFCQSYLFTCWWHSTSVLTWVDGNKYKSNSSEKLVS